MADAEASFIRFCQRVASFYPQSPYWLRNVTVFDAVFKEHLGDENLSKPVRRFIDTHREALQRPLFSDDEINDDWLSFPEDTPVPVAKKSWSVCHPRGVLLSQKKDDHSAVLPLSEVYLACQDIAESDRATFHGVSSKNYVVLFFQHLYEMLHEAEPQNTHFQDNATLAKGVVGPSRGPALPEGMPDLSKLLGGSMEGLLEKVSDEHKEVMNNAMGAIQEGDFGKVFSAVSPMLEQMMSVFGQMQTGRSDGAASATETATETVMELDVPQIEAGDQD